MSLVGNLEDLSLGDILQIVSLSRKSGALVLISRGREGRITFLNGQVIRASSTIFPENLGNLLLRHSLVSVESLKQALLTQRNSRPEDRLGTILAEEFGVSPEAIEEVVKEHVEKIVYSFFSWSEGTFSFELGEPEDLGATHIDPLHFLLEQGLNPQWLAMEGSRIFDERLHRGESTEEDEGEAPVELETLLEGEEGFAAGGDEAGGGGDGFDGTVLLVDDDALTRQEIRRLLEERGCRVLDFGGGEEFLAELAAHPEKGRTLLLVDLIMPRMDGSGLLGGMEILETLQADFPHLPAVLISEHPNPEAEAKALELGAKAVLQKPKKNEVKDRKGLPVLEQLVEDLARFLVRKRRPASGSSVNWRAELLQEIGEELPTVRKGKGPESPGLHLLKNMLQELNNPALGGGIVLLVLRFASELMNRAVFFQVKGEHIVGLGQFGIELDQESPDLRIRRMKIPRAEDSVFAPALKEMSCRKTTLGDSPWDRYVLEQLGGNRPGEVFVGPILSQGKVVAFIYGDNLPQKKPIGDTESFEIFLSQAGLAMEKNLHEGRAGLTA